MIISGTPNSTEIPGAGTGRTMGNARISSHAPIERVPRKSAMSASTTRSLFTVRACSAKSSTDLARPVVRNRAQRRSAGLQPVPKHRAEKPHQIPYCRRYEDQDDRPADRERFDHKDRLQKV